MFVVVLLMARRLPIIRRISLSLLIPYIFMVLVATIIVRTPSEEPSILLTPFRAFKEAQTSDFWDFEVRANILLFIPVGFLLSMTINRINGYPLLLGVLFSITIEIVQYFTHRGVCETDDVIANSIGLLMGYVLFLLFKAIELLIKKLRAHYLQKHQLKHSQTK